VVADLVGRLRGVALDLEICELLLDDSVANSFPS
jgi:hypothetical protein